MASVKMFRRNNGKLYLEYKAYGKTVQKSTRLVDSSKNRAFVNKEVIPTLEHKIVNGDFSSEKPQNFIYYAKRYLKKKQSKKTYKKICSYIDVIAETFGDIQIDKIKVSDIDDWVNERKKINCSKTIKNYLSSMSGVFKEAIKAEVISKNNAHQIELDSHSSEKIEPFSNKEVQKLLKNTEEPLRTFIAIGFFTGLRTGEILALTSYDINLEKREIYVRKAITEGKLQSPKTDASVRTVPIFDELVPYLKRNTEKGFLFCKGDKTHYANFPGHYKRAWEKSLTDTSIKYRKIYGTRHTFIVSMIKNSNMSILEIAQMAGHTTINMIINHYAKYIKNEHLGINKSLKLFTDNLADSAA
jgi:integrase